MIEGIHLSNDADQSRNWFEKVGFSYLERFGGIHRFAIGLTTIMLHLADQPNPGDTFIHIAI